MGNGKWEEVCPSGNGMEVVLDALLPGPVHTVVRNTETGEAKEVWHNGDIGEAIANGQFTDKDVSQCDSSPSSGSSGCFITTACIEAAGLPDNCDELQILRKFRDEHVQYLQDGKEMLSHYYSKAPEIVSAISRSASATEEYHRIFDEVQETVRCIISGQESQAVDVYRQLVQRLERTYLS